MTRADWTYELPPVTGESVWLEEYLVYDCNGEPIGRVFAVLEHDGERWLGIEREPWPMLHDRRVVSFEQIREADHENLSLHLALSATELEDALELDPGKGVEQGGSARRITDVPPGELPRRDAVSARDRAAPGVLLYVAALAAVVGMLALLAVFVFWGAGNSSAALPYFAVPGVLFGLSAALGYRAWSRPPSR
jgi:hypothetical protein